MDIPEIKARLESTLTLRIPQVDPDARPQERIEALEDYVLKIAYARADLEEALYWLIEGGKVLRAKWDGVEGWQVAVRGSRPTKEQVDRAKAEIDPSTYAALQEARTLVDHLKRQIARLGGSDYDAASRVYTMLSGQ
jgi:hypothetical protein